MKSKARKPKLSSLMGGAPRGKWVALFLSAFLPGLGQLYLGEYRNGIVFLGLVLIAAVTAFIGIGYYLYFLVWVGSMVLVLSRFRRRQQS